MTKARIAVHPGVLGRPLQASCVRATSSERVGAGLADQRPRRGAAATTDLSRACRIPVAGQTTGRVTRDIPSGAPLFTQVGCEYVR